MFWWILSPVTRRRRVFGDPSDACVVCVCVISQSACPAAYRRQSVADLTCQSRHRGYTSRSWLTLMSFCVSSSKRLIRPPGAIYRYLYGLSPPRRSWFRLCFSVCLTGLFKNYWSNLNEIHGMDQHNQQTNQLDFEWPWLNVKVKGHNRLCE